MNEEIQIRISESCDRAVENGYREFVTTETPATLAIDMVDYDAGIAKLVEEEFNGDEGGLIPYIEVWQRSQSN